MEILIAEDDRSSRSLIEHSLRRWGYQVIATADGDQAWQVLQRPDAPRLAILDWRMPGLDGLTLCRRIRAELTEPYVYVILLTGQDRDEDLITGMEAGADDYITKPFRQNELKVRLRAGRRIVELQNELLAARERLQQKASHDSLTGVWNHEEILRILSQELARAERDQGRVAVIMADLDHFKTVNDTYGHLAGDAVIRLAAERMRGIIRPYDHIGRYGGEEFMMVLADCGLPPAVAFAERLRRCINGTAMDTADGLIPLTVSLGVAASEAAGTTDAQVLLRAADAALYRAKKTGRDRVAAAPPASAAASSC